MRGSRCGLCRSEARPCTLHPVVTMPMWFCAAESIPAAVRQLQLVHSQSCVKPIPSLQFCALTTSSPSAGQRAKSAIKRPTELHRRPQSLAGSSSAAPASGIAKEEQMENLSADTAVVIVDHGSRRDEANSMLEQFAKLFSVLVQQTEIYRQQSHHKVVEVAHMELARPSISDAVAKCAAAGARTVIIAPYFLSRGRHIQEDIPALVKEAEQQHTGLRCVVADPIGLDPLMAQLINNRVTDALAASNNGHIQDLNGA